MYTTTEKTNQFKVGDRAYIQETEISGDAIETQVRLEVPCTNRGLQRSEGWLGSWTETSGTTLDFYARGLCEVSAIIEMRTTIAEYNPYDRKTYYTPGDIWGYETTWVPVNG